MSDISACPGVDKKAALANLAFGSVPCRSDYLVKAELQYSTPYNCVYIVAQCGLPVKSSSRITKATNAFRAFRLP
jgi:hypothetical protein